MQFLRAKYQEGDRDDDDEVGAGAVGAAGADATGCSRSHLGE